MNPRETTAPPPSPSDEILVRRVLQGEDEAFRSLMARHQGGIYRLAYHWTGNRDDALDLCQECFLHLYRVLDRYDNRYRFHVWMYKVSTNRCINWLKANRRAREMVPFSHLNEEAIDLPDRAPDPHDRLSRAETHRLLRDAMRGLPEKYQTPIVLRFMEDLSYKEIAAAMGITVKNVEIRLHRAKRMLYESLKSLIPPESADGTKDAEKNGS